MMSEHDEMLIQRCVDNECSSDERRILLERMESVPDGWQSLACAFLEEQLFQKSCGEWNKNPPEKALTQPQEQIRQRHWFYHPATSMVLSACILILLGVIFVGEINDADRQPDNSVANAESSSMPSGDDVQQATVVTNEQPNRVRLESNGMTTQEFPLYTDPVEFFSGLRQMRQQSYQLARDLVPTQNLRPEIRYLNLQLENGESIVVPIEEILIRHQFQ